MLTLRSGWPSVVTSAVDQDAPGTVCVQPAIMRSVAVVPQPDGPRMVVRCHGHHGSIATGGERASP